MSFVAVLVLAAAGSAFAAPEPTALQLIKEGNKFVGEPSKDKVLEIASDKSIAGLVPTIWTVSYYDPDAKSKVAEVKFGSGLKLEVNRPWKLFGGGKEDKIFKLDTLKVDSDKALKIATGLQVIAPFTLKNSQISLQRNDDGVNWKVRLWAAKLGKADAIMEIGDVYISPTDGKVVKAELHLDRLN